MTSCLGAVSCAYIGDLDPVGSENVADVFLNVDVRTWGELLSMDVKRGGYRGGFP